MRRTIRPKYACRACETITTAPTLPSIIDRGVAAPGLIAHVLVAKYSDHLPLYRRSQMLARSGVELPVSTLSSWVGAVGVALQPLVDALRRELQCSRVLHADETPVRKLDPGRGKTKTAYLFAYRRGETAEPPIVVFDYADSRGGKHAHRFLAGYAARCWPTTTPATSRCSRRLRCASLVAGHMEDASSSSCTPPTRARWRPRRWHGSAGCTTSSASRRR